MKNKKGKKNKKKSSIKVRGVFSAASAGFGFVKTEDGKEEYFIPYDCTGSAMHGDTVEIHVTRPASGRKNAEAEITRVIERAAEIIVGTFEAGRVSRRTGEAAYGFVIPDNKHYIDDIFVSRERSKGASDGDKVAVKITEYGVRSRNRKSEGIITEILGTADTPGIDITSLVKSYGLPERFPKEVLREADEAASRTMNLKGRKDLRDVLTITIDGDDSKDFDDAVSLVKKDNGYELGVHIADVSEYVREGTLLDGEALRRGTSVYLPDRVIPMLPEVLSNDICSLCPGEDRLTLSCLMSLDEKGKVKRSRITESVIRSRHRMTYRNVQKILDGDEALKKEYEDAVPMLQDMAVLSGLIRRRREKHGAIDFDLPEPCIILDGDGRVSDVRVRERDDASRLIEDFMLLANETVARTFYDAGLPFLYRVHDDPDEEGIRELGTLALRLGFHIKFKKDGKTEGKELQKLLKETEGSDAERLIRTLLLRSMSQAGYSDNPKGHFGLAMEHYTHFTSPIRRYPDLQIHRIIKEYLRNSLNEKKIMHYSSILGEVALKSGMLERRADDVEREADKLKMVEYMQSHIGDEYDGIISGVTEWGIYVELENCIEGMVPLRDMTDDYYELEKDRYQVVGRALHRKYTLGDPVRVMCVRADKLEGEIDFEIRY